MFTYNRVSRVNSQAGGDHLILYDGVCGLCSRLTRFVLDRDSRAEFSFASLQSEAAHVLLQKFGKNPDDLDTFFVLADYRSGSARLYDRSQAALFVLGHLNTPLRVLSIAKVLPGWLLDILYRLVARHRYRIFGRSDQCWIPKADELNRFIDLRPPV